MKSVKKAEEAYRRSKKKPLGEGTRFRTLADLLAARGAKNPRGLAAYIGRKRYGKRKFADLSLKGRGG